MKAGQKLEKDGKQVCLFPMEIMNITQWSSPSEYSHCCGHPFDNAISGQVSVPVYAPFDCHLIHTYPSGNTRVYQSDNEVWTPKGLKTVVVSFTHDPNPPTETQYKQGDLIYHTGTAGIVPPKGILMLVRPGRIRVRPNRKADAVGFLYRAMEQPVCLLNGKRGGHQHAHRTHVRLFLVWVVFVPQVAVSASQVEVVDILFAVLAQRVEIKGRVASEQLHLHFVLRDIGHDGCAFQGQQLRDQAKREFLACKEFQRHGAVLQRTEDL